MRIVVKTTDGETGYIGTPQFEEGGVLRIDPDDPRPDDRVGAYAEILGKLRVHDHVSAQSG